MSVNSSRNSSDRTGKKSSSQPPNSKSLRRDHSQVTPESPDSPVSSTSLRVLLQEAISPVTQELDGIKRSIKANSRKLDAIAQLTTRCTELETENASLKKRLEAAENKCQSIEERLLILETRSRRNNLKFMLTKAHKIDKPVWLESDC